MAPARAEAGREGLGLQKGGAWLGPKRGAQRARRGHATHPGNRWAAGRGGGRGPEPRAAAPLASSAD